MSHPADFSANTPVVKDERGHPRARLEMQRYAPCLTFYDSSGTERLKIGLRRDGGPVIWVDGGKTPLLEV